MPLLTGLTPDGLEVPVQVKPDGKLVAEGLTGPAGGDGPQGPAGPVGPQGADGNAAAISGTAARPGLTPVGDEDTGIYSPGADTIAFAEGGVEAMRIDSGSRLLVGTTSARTSRLGTSNFQTQLQVETGNNTAGLAVTRFNDSAGSTFVILQKGRGAIASPAAVIANDITGTILFSGWDGAAFTNSAFIRSEVDGTPGANDMPGRLVFSTTAAGGITPTERMRIKASGVINFANTPVHADNADARAGGLVAGDIYRKADGALMITF